MKGAWGGTHPFEASRRVRRGDKRAAHDAVCMGTWELQLEGVRLCLRRGSGAGVCVGQSGGGAGGTAVQRVVSLEETSAFGRVLVSTVASHWCCHWRRAACTGRI